MNEQEIKQTLTTVLQMSEKESIAAKKSTHPGTWYIGAITGNRLNKSLLRSQFIVCESKADWDNSESNACKALQSDQRVFVQVDDDVWDVYAGAPFNSESREPVIIAQNKIGLNDLLTEAKAELLHSTNSTVSSGGAGEGVQENILAAIRTKPFILLAGISGTGKSRMVRQLARGCCPRHKDGSTTEDHPLYNEQKPGNFEMIQVRPNWHDSTELMGYVTRMGTKPEYVMTPFVEFLAKAWLFPNVPFFLCLDEMNLAPVEQYFAEYLSVIETRRLCDDGDIMTDPLVRCDVAKLDDSDTGLAKFVNQCVETLLKKYWSEATWHGKIDPPHVQKIKEMFLKDSGIRIPKNLVVIGTVNMDETTFSFSRKVLDRAMSFELTDVEPMYTVQPADKIEWGTLLGQAEQHYVSAEDLYFLAHDSDTAAKNKERGEKVLASIKKINDFLDDTPFKIAYRSRNEIMLYCIERTACVLSMLPKALDEAISMKILSRVEGDEQRLTAAWLESLSNILADEINDATCTICSKKIEEMQKQLGRGYASFWTR